jgi:hypothetical protein
VCAPDSLFFSDNYFCRLFFVCPCIRAHNIKWERERKKSPTFQFRDQVCGSKKKKNKSEKPIWKGIVYNILWRRSQ